MKQVGARLLYDEDGEIVAVLCQFESPTGKPRKQYTKINYLDMPFGFIDNKIIKGYDTIKNELIYEEINSETEEQRRIRELEDTLLLQTENEVGGIL